MELVDKTFISLTNKVSFLYSDFDNNGKRYITVQNLLEHNSGKKINIKVFRQLIMPLYLRPQLSF